MTGGRGVDVVLEAVGRNETIAAAIDCVRKGGTVTLIGNITPQVTLPLQKVVSRQIRLQGSCASSGEYPKAMELMAAGKIRVAATDYRGCAAQRRTVLVRSSSFGGAKSDEGGARSSDGIAGSFGTQPMSENSVRSKRPGGFGDGGKPRSWVSTSLEPWPGPART